MAPQYYRRGPAVPSSRSKQDAPGDDYLRGPRPPPWQQPQGFPFWKIALSIATGILIASAIGWIAVEARMRYEADQLAAALQKEMQAIEAADVRRRQEFAQRQAVIRQQQAQQAEQRRQAEARRDKRPLIPQALESMQAGTIACLGGYKAQRTANRRWKQLVIAGKAQPCRTG